MAGFNLKAVVTCVDKLSPQLNTMKGKLEKFQKTMNKSGFGKLGLKDAVTGLAISAPFVKGVKDAMAYEEVMADIRKVVDFDTPEQFKQMGQDIREMSLQLPMAAKDIGAIVAAGGQAGIPKDDLKQFAEDAVKMGIAFDTTAEEAGSTMATWRTALKMTQGEVVSLSDKINLLSNTQNAKARDISDVVSRIGTLAAQSGVGADKLAALSSTIIATGTNTEQAATGIKNFMLTLTSGKAATAKQQKALQQLGFTSTQIAKDMQKDAEGTIMKVLESLGKVSADRRAAALTVLFGKESVAAISPLLNNIDLLKANFNRVGDAAQYAGSMQKEYDSRSSTTANKLQLFNNALMNVSLSIGDALLPAFTELLEELQPLIVEFGHFIQANPELVKMVAMAVAGLIGLRVACAGVNIIVGTLSTSITVFNGILKGVTLATKLFTFAQIALSNAFKIVRIASLALTAVMAMNPIGLIMTGIAVAATLIITYWDDIVKFFQWLWGVIKPYVMPIIDVFIAGVKVGASFITSAWGAVGKFFCGLWETIKPYVMPIFDVFITPLKAAGDLIPKLWEKVQNFFKKLWDNVKSGIQPLLDSWTYLFGDKEKNIKVNVDTSSLPKEMTRPMVMYPYYETPQLPMNNFSNSNTANRNSKGELVVKFENAPPGTIVKETKQSKGFAKADVGWSPFTNFNFGSN
ncbi:MULTISPECIES: phage tail tape measure protein [unclassified Gilliamella]|uniref:phage tail tape measure protein n=1 Tax=unclassified Gilliamella TaxID=2685620 RepID=UPI00226A7230|nr:MULTISPECIES: phage tail tape measure protein [unclassified Gilliamella]MCX8641669.1 phage tail tape measure protein [Gilliamella sp. B3835]MCX8706470.1 phage tail tape measure protein [Gilliamella sp. B3783]MCX8709187.1 phage tail tape measure protein [Gilliamella sp. B3780]MCX8714559.1 phage tail tape measure protein [Gilliamella sp. B3781]MCX8715926.1 phage tail tape measure protein [Gilliamella sp. B3784]